MEMLSSSFTKDDIPPPPIVWQDSYIVNLLDKQESFIVNLFDS